MYEIFLSCVKEYKLAFQHYVLQFLGEDTFGINRNAFRINVR